MSVLHTLLAVDGSPQVLGYLKELGLGLPATFRSRFPREDEVEQAVRALPGHALGAPEEQTSTVRFVRMLQRGPEPLSALHFAARADGPAVLAGLRGDPCLPLLKLLARQTGPLVVLLNAQSPIVIDGSSR